ncbi:MAG: phosphoserine transaminase, partial [Alphaproteobacteria bacterium]|nr:phosphoserine transaminase [Alphaproteobacteria bacterium]
MKPTIRPQSPAFSSGPCAKRPGWSPDILTDALVGRSHRSTEGKARLNEVIDLTRSVLGIPADWRIGIVPASDTGAVEMALWSLLGPRGVDVLAWESFGLGWGADITKHLKLDDTRIMTAPYGALPDLTQTDPDRDIVFTWNGTTSGVKVPDGDWIADDRAGLTICDATSAVFAMELPWEKLDATTFSWQKSLGGEGGFGTLILSPRAVERLESHVPPWPVPKIFRLTKGGKLIEGIFRGETINTPSMLAVEDARDALGWAQHIGGLEVTMSLSKANLAVIAQWVRETDWVEFLAEKRKTRSNTSICLKVVDPAFTALSTDEQWLRIKATVGLLASEGAAFDIAGYRDGPPGFRIWGGPTVEAADTQDMLPWL